MIKFKKILDKAREQGAASVTGATFLAGSSRPRTAEAAPFEPDDSSTATSTAVEPEVAESLITNELMESVLEDMFPGESAGAVEPAEAETSVEPDIATAESWTDEAGPAPLAEDEEDVFDMIGQDDADAVNAALGLDETAENEPGVDTQGDPDMQAVRDFTGETVDAVPGEGVEQPSAQAQPAGPQDTAQSIENIIEDALAALTEETSDSEASAEAAAAEGEAPAGEATQEEEFDDQQHTGGIDGSFMAEVDRLLNEFGQLRTESSQDEEPSSDEPELAVDDLIEAAAQEVREAQDKAARAAEQPARTPVPGEAAKQAAHAAREPEPPAEASPAAPEKAAVKEASLADTLSQEEKDALFTEGDIVAAGEEPPSDDLFEEDTGIEAVGDMLSREVDAMLDGSQDNPLVQGPEAAVEIDLSRASVGLDEETGDGDVTLDTDSLLGRVLGDLDRLGEVEKQPHEEDTQQEEPIGPVVEDFSQILSELESATPDQQNGNVSGAVEVKAESLSEEQLLDEAIKAAEEATQQRVGEAGGETSQPGEDEPGKKKTDAKKAEAPAPDEPPSEPAADEFEESGDAKEAELQDEQALLANLEASMDAAGVEDGKDEPGDNAGEAEDTEDEEDIIRKEVLSRSKEVEQKVLDDVFGENSKDYSAEIRAEMAGADQPRQKSSSASALAEESARLAGGMKDAAEGALSNALLRPEQMGASLLWVAYQINRPFRRWLSPEVLRIITPLVLGLLGTGLLWLVLSLVTIWYNL